MEQRGDDEMDPGRASIHPVMEDIEYTYTNNDDQRYHDEEDDDDDDDDDDTAVEGGLGALSPSSSIVWDERYATGGGAPLQRQHSDDSNGGNPGYDTASVFGEHLLLRAGSYDDRGYYARRRKRRVKRGIAMMALAPVVIGVVGLSVGFYKGRRNGVVIAEPRAGEDFKAEIAKEEVLKEEFYANLRKEGKEILEEEAPVTKLGLHPPFANSDWQDTLPKTEQQGAADSEKEESNNLPPAAVSETVHNKESEDHANNNNAAGPDHYYNAIIKYGPIMYDRHKGWTGQTFKEALVFCEVAAGLALCPYDAICPLGTSGEPLGGFRDGPHGDWAWMPILDGFNEWVQAGARERCIKYSNKFGEDPEWGMTGKGIQVEGITQNLLCCKNVM